MKSTTEHIQYLWQQYVAQKATAAEVDELFSMIKDASGDAANAELFHAAMENYPPEKVMDKEVRYQMLQDILKSEKASTLQPETQKTVYHRVHFLRTAWFRYAAAVLLLLGTGAYFFLQRQQNAVVKTNTMPADIQPGGHRATLTLADGTVIVLDSAANGALASQGNTKIIKLDAGSLSYNADGSGGEDLYNTISTPKGGQYQITLPDGTKVWLNAASSIRFPTAFNKDRIVDITGESYLEVAPDKSKPFLVKTGNTTVHVLGTSFNINAYTDEPATKTTLINGVIKINNAILKPGQAYMDGNIVSTNTEQDLAWKSGLFNFNEVSLQQAMRQISKWYDIEVIYEGNIPAVSFFGKIPRKVGLSTVLEALKGFGLNCKMEGRKLIVMP